MFQPLEYVRPTYRTAYKLHLGSSVLHLGQPQPQPQPFNPLIPNELRRRRTVRPLKIKIPSKNLGRQRCAEGFNFVAKRLNAELNPNCHLLALLGGATIVVFSRLRVNVISLGTMRDKIKVNGIWEKVEVQ